MAKERFYFHLLEVTIVQMLKAHGFDRAENRHVLEVLVDMTIRYFKLITTTVLKYMEIRDDNAPNIKDIAKAFLELNVITPNIMLDKYDTSSVTKTGIENFEKWFNSEINERMREIGRPDRNFLEERKKEKLAVQKVSSKMDDLTKALDEQSKQAQLQNPTMPYLPSPSLANSQGRTPSSMTMTSYGQGFPQMVPVTSRVNEPHLEENRDLDYKIPTEAIEEDWIQYMIRHQIISYNLNQKINGDASSTITSVNGVNNSNRTVNEGANIKPSLFKGTVLEEYIPKDLHSFVGEGSHLDESDFLIAGPISEKLLHTFPYYKSDDESSESDSDLDSSSGDEDSKGQNDSNAAASTTNTNQHVDVDNHANSRLAEYDYYEHHNVYDDQMDDLDLYGQNDTESNGLNLFG